MHPPQVSKRSSNATNWSGSGSSLVKIGFMDLPLETQKEIVKHVHSRKDITSLQRVSRHFHRLASAKLYKNLGFILTHADSPNYYSSAQGRLADALHLFATSDYDYGIYVKSFVLRLSEKDSEDIQRRVLSKYHWEEEATKLLNTSILLMLRKTRTLEVFGWDAAIELNGFIYDALSKIETLHELSIRLDTRTIPRIASYTLSPPGPINIPPPPGQFGQPSQATFTGGFSTSSSSLQMTARQQKANPNIIWSGKRKFSSFKDLRHLAILGIDSLDCLHEFATCMTNSSATLKQLHLSLSLDLARRARKPASPSPPTNQAQDMLDGDEDDDDMTPPSEPPVVSNPTPVNEADIKREKAAQDSVLAKIFGLEPAKAEDNRVDRALKATAASFRSKESPDEIFLEEMKKIMTKLIQITSMGHKGLINDKNILKHLEKGVDKYLQSNGHKSKKLKSATSSLPYKYTTSAVSGNMNKGGPSQSSNSLHLSEWKNAYQAFQDLIGSEHASPGEFENFMLANAGHLSPYPTSFQPMSYYAEKTSTPFGASTSSSAAAPYQITHSFQTQPHTSVSLTGSHHYHAPKSYSAFPGPSAISKVVPPSFQQFKQDMYEKAMLEEEDQAIQEMILESASKPGEPAEIDSDSDNSELPDAATPKDTVVANGEVQASSSPSPPAIQSNAAEREDDMDIDMEHPDVIESDTEDDQTFMDDDIPVAASAKKPFSPVIEPPVKKSPPNEPVLNGPSSRSQDLQLPPQDVKLPIKSSVRKTMSAEETMQEYIRTKHGFHIEELMLYLIPLKPSVIGRALDLSCLRELTLLNVGQQGGFWSFVDKVQKESVPIQFRHIHTDDVSIAFLNCIANISGLQNLFMMRRSPKDSDFSSSAAPASLANIRTLALRKHISTLQRLVIMNNEDESWDLDPKTLRLLTVKGAALTELAFSVNVSDYHVLMQGIRGLTSLIAMHVLAIRATDQCQSIGRESRKFTIDNITHCPELKIRYLAMTGVVFELARKPKSRKVKRDRKGKGKGKAKEGEVGGGGGETDSDNFSEIEEGGLEMACVKHLKFTDVRWVRIFSKEVRTGKL